MSKHLDLGKKGETLAVQYLQQRGYSILDVNWRYKKTELDIIATYKNLLIIVEVKTRSNDSFGFPEEAVNFAKQKRIFIATEQYLSIKNINLEVQYDIISILNNNNSFSIEHYQDAFYPYNAHNQ